MITEMSPQREDSEQIALIKPLIMEIRGVQVMIDRDLAMLYGVESKRINEQVKRNIIRFPETFRFQLTEEETSELVANCDRLNLLKHSSSHPYVFTEQGVAMLSTVLHSETAVRVSIQIMNAFVSMRHFISSNSHLFNRIETLEHNQLVLSNQQQLINKQMEDVLGFINHKMLSPEQGVFYEGQIFDAYLFISERIREATQRIVLWDNYIDDTVLTLLDKREKNVRAIIYTKNISPKLNLDIKKHNMQYPPIEVKSFLQAHDRFLCVDETVYHIGASLKDLGKKWVAFCKMQIKTDDLINRM